MRVVVFLYCDYAVFIFPKNSLPPPPPWKNWPSHNTFSSQKSIIFDPLQQTFSTLKCHPISVHTESVFAIEVGCKDCLPSAGSNISVSSFIFRFLVGYTEATLTMSPEGFCNEKERLVLNSGAWTPSSVSCVTWER